MVDMKTNVEIDPFDASASIIRGAPEAVRARVSRNLQAPASRSDLLDLVTAQAEMNTSLAAALVSMWQKNDERTNEAIGKILDQAQRISNMIGKTAAHSLMMPDPYVRSIDESQDDG